MRLGLATTVFGSLLLCGCLPTLTIPPLEAAIGESCQGRDRMLASAAGAAAYRCGEGPRARYAVYKDGALVKEVGETEAMDFAAGLFCLNQGFQPGSPELAACRRESAAIALARSQARGAAAGGPEARAVLAPEPLPIASGSARP